MSINEKIIQAVFDGDKAKLNEILNTTNDVDLNAITNLFGTPLMHIAAAAGHTEMVLALIEQGLDVNAENTEGATALDFAYNANNAYVARQLINHGGRENLATAPARDIVFNDIVDGYWDDAPADHEWAEYHVQRGQPVMGETPLLCHCDGEVY